MIRHLLVAVVFLSGCCQQAHAAFTTIYNVPPDIAPSSIGPNTQLNLFEGANPIYGFSASGLAELNVFGGFLDGGLSIRNGATANINGGTIEANISGLSIVASGGGIVNINGGTVGSIIDLRGGTVNLHGGKIGRKFRTSAAGNSLKVYGGERQTYSGELGIANAGVLEDGSVYIFDIAGTSSYSAGLHFMDSPVPPLGPLVINAPTDAIPKGLRTGQTLNLGVGGMVPDDFKAMNSSIHITGGQIGNRFGGAGTTIDLDDGSIGDEFVIYGGTTVNVDDGHIGSRFGAFGGSINMHGGSIGDSSLIWNDAIANIDGGSIGDGIYSESTSKVNLMGGEFILDGAPVSGPAFFPFNTSYLTGTLADGSVFIFTPVDGDQFDRSGATRSLNLSSAALPAAPAIVNAPVDPVPKGLRSGQTLNLGVGASIPNLFAAVNATMNINGGSVGNDVEVIGTQVTINSGTVGNDFEAHPGSNIVMNGGSVGDDLGLFSNTSLLLNDGMIGDSFGTAGNVTINGGEIGDDFGNGSTTTVNINGGKIGDSYVAAGTVNVSGGNIGDGLRNTGTIHISEGSIGDKIVNSPTGTLNMTGGSFGQEFWGTRTNFSISRLILNGGQFEKDGVSVTSSSVDLEHYDIFSGVLADGTVFILSSSIGDRFDGFSRPSLIQAAIPAVGAPIINAPADAIPKGLRAGQTLNLVTGAQVGVNFAAIDATININGGEIAKGLELLRSTLTLNTGAIGDRFAAHDGSVVHILGGTVGEKLFAGPGSVVNVLDGVIGNDAKAKVGSDVVIEGGSIGDNFLADVSSSVEIKGGSIGANFSAEMNSRVVISGGNIGQGFSALRNSFVNIGGGTFGEDFTAVERSNVSLFGMQFEIRDLLTGTLIEDLDAGMTLGETLDIDLRDVTLTGILADNTPFSFDLHSFDGSGDFFDTGAFLSITLSDLVLPPDVPEPSSLVICSVGLLFAGAKRHRTA